jgi:hypothetical protein
MQRMASTYWGGLSETTFAARCQSVVLLLLAGNSCRLRRAFSKLTGKRLSTGLLKDGVKH